MLLGWNQTKEPDACTGPYESAQVVWLGVALAATVLCCATWRGEWGAAGGLSVTTTALWIGDVLTVDDPCDVGASLWPIGAALVLSGSAGGLGLIAALARLARHPSR